VIKSAFDSKVEGPVLLPQEMLEKTLPRIIVAPAVARLWVHVVNAEPLHVRQQRAEKNDTKKENVERAEHPRPAVNADGDDAGRGEKNEGVLVAQAEAHDRGAYERSAALAVVGKAHCDIEKRAHEEVVDGKYLRLNGILPDEGAERVQASRHGAEDDTAAQSQGGKTQHTGC